MAAITARWSRGVQIDGELETLGMEVSLGTTEADPNKVLALTADLDRKLALAGDALVLERLESRQKAPRTARVQRPGTAKAQAPDVVQVPAQARQEPPRPAPVAPTAQADPEDPYLLG